MDDGVVKCCVLNVEFVEAGGNQLNAEKSLIDLLEHFPNGKSIGFSNGNIDFSIAI